jgi:hypothetical protein
MENVGEFEPDPHWTEQLLLNFRVFNCKKILVVNRVYAAEYSCYLPKYLNKHKNYDIIIFDDATPYLRNYDARDMYNNLIQLHLTKPWIIITSDFNYYKSAIKNIVYYPFHFLVGIYSARKTELDIKQLRKHYLGFLSFHNYEIRLITFLKLYQQKWFDKCLANYKPSHELTPRQLQVLQNSIAQLNESELNLLEKFNKQFPHGIVADSSTTGLDFVSIDNTANTDCYINLMIESEYNLPFITEKTIKPYLCGQFSAVLGNNFLYQHLQNLGIDTLQDYLEMQVWNSDPRQTIDTILNRLSDLIVNIEQSWIDTYPRRLDNYYYVRSDKFINKLDDGIKEWLT